MARVPKSYPVDPVREREVAHFQYLNQVPPLQLGGPVGVNPSFDFSDEIRKPYIPEDHGYKPHCRIHVEKPPPIVPTPPCVIRLDVLTAEGVWNLEGDDVPKSRAAVSIQFPGEKQASSSGEEASDLESSRSPKTPRSPMSADASEIDIAPYQMLLPLKGSTPNIPPKEDIMPGREVFVHSAPSTPGSKKSDHSKGNTPKEGKKTQEKKDDKKGNKKAKEAEEPPPPPVPATFEMRVGREIERFSEWKLWHTFMHEPIVITLYKLSHDGSSKVAIAKTKVDLNPLLHFHTHSEGSPENPLQFAYPLELLVESSSDETSGKKGKKGAPPKNPPEKKIEKGGKEGKDNKSSNKKGKSDATQEPALLPGASLKVTLHTSYPLLSKINQEEGLFMEITEVKVRPLPLKVLDFFEQGTNPFNYKLGFYIPGFTGAWWKNLRGIEQEEKNELCRITASTDTLEMDPPPPVLFPELLEEAKLAEAQTLDAGLNSNKPNEEIGDSKKTKEKEESSKVKEKGEKTKKKEGDLEIKGVGKEGAKENTAKNSSKDGKHSDTPKVVEKTKEEILLERKKKFLKWEAASCRRFLPGEAVDELLLSLKKKKKYSGEIARYLKDEQPDLVDPFFQRYHGNFDMYGLSGLLGEGATEVTITCPILPELVIEEPPPLCPPQIDRVVTAKSKPVDDEETTTIKTKEAISKKGKPAVEGTKEKEVKSPKSAKDIKSPKEAGEKPNSEQTPLTPILNAWNQVQAEVIMTIKLSRPLEPIWVPPPQPEVDLLSFIGAKPKAPTVYDTGEIAAQEFRDFVMSSAVELANFYHTLVDDGKLDPSNAKKEDPDDEPSNRSRNKERRRKILVQELHAVGTWKQIREDMKDKIMQIATEKFKVDKQEALGVGKFEFCNALYMYLMDEIQECLLDLLNKRKNTCEKMAERFDRDQPESIAKLQNLREKADQYENDADWRSANKYHLERLIGEIGIKDPDIWFEYGTFCMRVKPKDHGKAEECFREAISLKQDHVLSLMALGALMWHRNYLEKAQVLFRKATDVHIDEEFIPWMLLSQVYLARGERIHSKTCIRRAEKLHELLKKDLNEYAPPHLLLSPQWIFPFCLSQPIFESRALGASSPFVDAAIFLVDIHLPKEAIQLLGVDTDLFSCETDKALCCAKAYEVMGEYVKAGRVIVESLEEHPHDTSLWYSLGHLRYLEHRHEDAIFAFEKLRRYIEERSIQNRNLNIYVYIELGYSNLQLGNYNVARKLFIKGCKLKPEFCSFWLGAGISYYCLGNFEQAEIFLVEGNCKDITNFKIWGYLILMALTLERFKDAELSLEQSLKTFLNPKLLEDIGDSFANSGMYSCAERAYYEAINERPTNVTVRFKYGNTLIIQGKKDIAKKEFEKIAAMQDVSEGETFYGLQDNHGVTYFPKEYRRQTIQ